MHDTPTLPEKEFLSYAPGFWSDKNVSPADWNSSIWQLKNRITTLAQLEEHLTLTEEERNRLSNRYNILRADFRS